MKKLSLLFFCVIFIFTSCSPKPAPIAKCFSARFSANCNGVKAEGSITNNSHNITTVKITCPESMNGYTYSYKNNALTVKYRAMYVNAAEDYLPQGALPTVLYNILKSLNKEDNCYLSGTYNSYAEYKGSCDSGKYTITTEFSTGIIRKIRVDSMDFVCRLKNVKILD